MCLPAVAAGVQLVTGLASTALSFSGQRKAYLENARASLDAYGNDIEALNARQDQINRGATEDLLSNEIAAIEDRGRARAGASGLADISLGEVLQAVTARQDRAAANIRFNRDSAGQQTRREIRSAQAAANSRIASVQRPSLTAYAFQALGNITDAATTYGNLRNRGA